MLHNLPLLLSGEILIRRYVIYSTLHAIRELESKELCIFKIGSHLQCYI